MWIAIIIGIVILLVIRGIYKSTGQYEVCDSKGRVLHLGTWSDCLEWTRSMNSIGTPERFTIRRR